MCRIERADCGSLIVISSFSSRSCWHLRGVETIGSSISIGLKLTAGQTGLPNDRLESTAANLIMVGNGNRYSPLGFFFCITMWLRRRPAFFKIAQTSFPDRMRNLINRHLHLCDKDLVTEPLLDFFRRSGLEKKFQGFTQIIPRGFDGVPLACDIQFRA